MFHLVDNALEKLVKTILTREFPSTPVTVDFTAPTRGWSASQVGKITVGLYLYDVREDLSLRHNGPLRSPDPGGGGLAEYDPPRYARLSYMATAWAENPRDEHHILATLQTQACKTGILAVAFPDPITTLGLRAHLTVGTPTTEDRVLTELWSALETPLRPFLNFTVTTPLLSFTTHAPAPAPREVRIGADPRSPVPPLDTCMAHPTSSVWCVRAATATPYTRGGRRTGHDTPLSRVLPGLPAPFLHGVDAVLTTATEILVFGGSTTARCNTTTCTWSPPTTIADQWPGLPPAFTRVDTGFADTTGCWFFAADAYAHISDSGRPLYDTGKISALYTHLPAYFSSGLDAVADLDSGRYLIKGDRCALVRDRAFTEHVPLAELFPNP
ncbi:Pvc16 family protein [Nocardia terpenica]|uniref:DUF4255 domain-containing protein n=1 Tax=Nocardia terpenica TaxID=455432 RepID=A0A6G9ZD23_9NOCA|nr:Pvc16 family protein [Nocardia terpenica]QIS23519.1 DUF4255 domain-containing protein [Nocardia terpenica]